MAPQVAEFFVSVGGSTLIPDKFEYSSGLSLIWLSPEMATLGLVINPLKLSCAECNTPVAEINAGSLVIRSKHHSQRHVTSFSKNDLMQLFKEVPKYY